jgi:hypothetical protein
LLFKAIMRRFYTVVLLAVLFLRVVAGQEESKEFKLTNGDRITGKVASVNVDGIVIQQDIGGFTERIGWGRLDQDTLKLLLDNPQAHKFAEPFIEVPIEQKVKEKAKKKEIVIKEPTRVERPTPRPKFFASLTSPAGFMVLGILFFANLYAAYHIAQFRGRSVPLVVGLSAVAPVLGPIIFLLTPDAEGHGPPPVEQAAPSTDVVSAEAKVGGMQSALGLAAHQKGEQKGANQGAEVYRRADTTFDRRFFETKFTGFFRVVPANPDMVLVVKTQKQEYVARRISRISAAEVHLQLLRGNTEVGVPFGEIAEVQVRHKDAKS